MKLNNLKIVAFESRRAKEMAELIRRYGGEPMVAPSMREIPLSENLGALELLSQLEKGQFDLLMLMTGVGTKALVKVWQTTYPVARIIAALRKVQIVARGPKPVSALKELGLRAAIVAPEPNTWRELVSALDAAVETRDKRIAVQEYGIASPDLVAALESRGAVVTAFPIYRWALPEDLTPLRQAIRQIIDGRADVALFTNGAQVDHLFRVAAASKLHDALRCAFAQVAIGSVGPVCSQVLEQFGIPPDIEPPHPKMGALIAEVAASASRILALKRAV